MSISSHSIRLQAARVLLMLSAISLFQTDANGQDVLPPPAPSNSYVDEVGEAMLRGPVHEAFAEQVNPNPVTGMVIAQQPPEPIEELPPEVRPEGPRVEWISGYWAWDEDRQDFIWVSGVWRKLPPDVAWLPGYWAEVAAGYQWIAGTWVAEQREQIDYIAQAPPESLELGPVGNAPSDEYFWISGHWVWQGSSYAWAPGYWTKVQPNWVWVPTRYLYTPRGYVYCNGYWDYPLVSRGTLFAPYWFSQRPNFVAGNYFRPKIVVALNLLPWHLWVRPQYQHYYFGDYYSASYRTIGIQPWHTYYRQSHGYDPLFTYYERTRETSNLSFYQVINQQFNLSLNQSDRRPPRSYHDQLRLGLSPDLLTNSDRFDRDIDPRGIDDGARLVLGATFDDWLGNKNVGFANLSDNDLEEFRYRAVERGNVAKSRRDAEVVVNRDRDSGRQRDDNRFSRTEPSDRGSSWRLPLERLSDSGDQKRLDQVIARDRNDGDAYRAARPAVGDQTPPTSNSDTRQPRQKPNEQRRSPRDLTDDLNGVRPEVSDVIRSPDTRLAPSSNLRRDLILPGDEDRPNSVVPPRPDGDRTNGRGRIVDRESGDRPNGGRPDRGREVQGRPAPSRPEPDRLAPDRAVPNQESQQRLAPDRPADRPSQSQTTPGRPSPERQIGPDRSDKGKGSEQGKGNRDEQKQGGKKD